MRRYFILICTTLLFYTIGLAQPELEFEVITLGGPSLNQPVDITGCGDGSGRLFVVEKAGRIRIIENGAVLPTYFLDISSQVMNSGERGLLGLAFHPNFPATPYYYVNYVINNTITNRISRFTVDPNNPNLTLSGSELFLLSQEGVQTNHKAGDIAFGPDGYLYIGMGDGGGGGDPTDAGQNIETLLGKILRINVDVPAPPLNYSCPPDNPFVGVAGLDEIWAYGIRNPWRISFDRETGDLWIADVGQNAWEEVNYIPAGTPGGINFGWNCKEGDHNYEPGNCSPGTAFWDPIFEYPHSCNPCPVGNGASISGGFVYRGSQHPLLVGQYVCVDYISNYAWLVQPTGGNEADVITTNANSMINDVVTFGEDDYGEMFAASLGGTFYRVTEASTLAVSWGSIGSLKVKNGNQIEWTIFETFGIDHFEIERSAKPDFINASAFGNIKPVPDQTHYKITDLYNSDLGAYYRVVAYLVDGSKAYSPITRILPDPVSRPSLVFDAGNNMWRIRLPEIWQNGEMVLLDIQGKEVMRKTLSSHKSIELGPPIVPGCYFVKIQSGNEVWSEKVVL